MTRFLERIAAMLRVLSWRRRADEDLTAEMQFHLEREIEERVAHGMTPEAARQAALRSMGAVEKHKEECRELRGGYKLQSAIESTIQDARFALRLFRRQPLPAGMAILGLGLAIGVSTAVFTLFNASLFRPYGMDDPATVVKVAHPGHHWSAWPYSRFRELPLMAGFQGIEAARDAQVAIATSPAEEVSGPRRPVLFVSGGYLSLLGGRPAIGRSLGPADDLPGAPPVLVVSDVFWRGALNGDPDAVGRTLWLNDTPVTLVGVLRTGFTGPVDVPPAAWLCFSAVDDAGAGPAFSPTSTEPVEVVARLGSRGSLTVAQQSLSAVLTPNTGASSVGSSRVSVELRASASPISSSLEGDGAAGLLMSLILLALILALACANTGNLLLAASLTRHHEIGIRLAMGATRRRLVVQMLRESVLLASVAGGSGMILAVWLVPVLRRAVDLPEGLDYSMDWRVLLFTVGIVAIAGTAAGLAPARHGSRGNVIGTVHRQTPRVTTSRFRLPFVGFQAATSMVLVIVAALLGHSAFRTVSTPVGFDADHLLSIGYASPREALDEAAYLRQAVTVLSGLPSIEGVSQIQVAPFGWSRAPIWVNYRGHSYALNNVQSDASLFTTMGIRVLRGRPFTADEVSTEAPVALISESVARDFFAGVDPIGRSVSQIPAAELGNPARIIGVTAETFAMSVDAERSGQVYRPLAAKPRNSPGLVLRTSRPGAMVNAVERTLRQIDSRPQFMTWVVRERIDFHRAERTRAALVMTAASAIALLLGVVGIYGVTAFAVNQRMPEVGVRLAIGATGRDVVWLLSKDGLQPVAIGLTAGLAIGVFFARLFSRELSAISPYDPLALGAAILLLGGSALVAILLPARRASRVDPTTILRQI